MNVEALNKISELDEPFRQEIDRVRPDELLEVNALNFAFSLESVKSSPNSNFEASSTQEYERVRNPYFTRYTASSDSPSLGLVITDIERGKIELDEEKEPVLYTFGPERIRLALAQRAEFFSQSHNEKLYQIVEDILTGKKEVPHRPNRKHAAVERALDIQNGIALSTAVYSDFGYKKSSSDQEISRTENALFGLFNSDGRRVIGVGSLPPVSGWRDVVVTSAVGHMPVFIPRNSLFVDRERQIELVKESRKVIENLNVSEKQKDLLLRNIGVAIGTNNPEEELETAKKIHDETGTNLFRIYTINGDPRVIETAKLMKDYFGNGVELWVGQITDYKQAEKLIGVADTLVYGHAAGRQCTSGINGLAITMIEDIYQIVQDPKFNDTKIAVEGGVGKVVGIPLLLGVDYVLYNQQLVHGTIEAGNLLLSHKEEHRMCQPYPGSASPTTQIIESSFENLRKSRTASAGRTENPEGKPGFMFYERKANSMVFWVREFMGYAARMLADLGIRNMRELRELMSDPKKEVLRIVNASTAKLAEPYRNS